jgi:hypothetical protein
MPTTALLSYLGELPSLQAELKLLLLEVIQAPNLKRRDYRALVRRWEQAMEDAGAVVIRPKVAPPALLSLMGITVVHYAEGKPERQPG